MHFPYKENVMDTVKPSADTLVIFKDRGIWMCLNYHNPEMQGAGMSVLEALERLLDHHPNAIRLQPGSRHSLHSVLALALRSNDEEIIERMGICPNTHLVTSSLDRLTWLNNESRRAEGLALFQNPAVTDDDEKDRRPYWTK
jgi:hypothetical protein